MFSLLSAPGRGASASEHLRLKAARESGALDTRHGTHLRKDELRASRFERRTPLVLCRSATMQVGGTLASPAPSMPPQDIVKCVEELRN